MENKHNAEQKRPTIQELVDELETHLREEEIIILERKIATFNEQGLACILKVVTRNPSRFPLLHALLTEDEAPLPVADEDDVEKDIADEVSEKITFPADADIDEIECPPEVLEDMGCEDDEDRTVDDSVETLFGSK